MDFEQELERIADNYRRQGYAVTIRPGPDQLPSFARDFQIEILGRRGTEGVLVSVKKDRDAVAADGDMQKYAEITGNQLGWRFDFAIVEPENPKARELRGAREYSGEEITESLDQAERLSHTEFTRFALVAAWAGLEAAMRIRLRAFGRDAGWGSQPHQMVKELYSAGLLTPDEFRQVESAFQQRNQIVHGFAPEASKPQSIDPSLVQVLSEVARRLLSESQLHKQSA